jgi:hypothetical protein
MNTLLRFPEGGSAAPFGRLLRQWRDARHLSQLALATEAGISTSGVIATVPLIPENRSRW